MVDTVRTRAEILALLADNAAGDISPQDIRDMFISIMGVYGGIYIENGTTGQTLVAVTPEVLTEWTADGVAVSVTPAFASDQITIDNSGVYEISFNISIAGITGAEFHFNLRKNGSEVSRAAKLKTANTDTQSASFHAQLTLVAADILTIWIESDTNGTITVNHADFNVSRIG